MFKLFSKKMNNGSVNGMPQNTYGLTLLCSHLD